MKKLFICFFLLAGSCTLQDVPSTENPFVNNLIAAGLCEVNIGMDESGNTVYTVDASLPINYSITAGRFQFTRRTMPYVFFQSLDNERAIFRYPGFWRGEHPMNYPIYIGFVLYKGGLYQVAKKQKSPAADTLEAVTYFYSPQNIDFDTLIPGPLYQKPGTLPALK